MSNILKIEAFAGASGDMFLGALAGLAGAYESIGKLPALLHLEHETGLMISDTTKAGISCKHVKVLEKTNQHNKKEHQHQNHYHRHLKDIFELIDKADVNNNTKNISKEIFILLGTAEAEIHGKSLEEIHFHEVGAIDSIMDIVGSAWLIDQLKIEKTYATAVTTGFGFVETQHGKLPVPTPATQLLLHGFPTMAGDQSGELVTPTGAAILNYLQPSFELPALKELKTTYGPGEKDLEIPNTLRLSLCEEVERKENIYVLQTNIDDLPGEYLGLEFQEKLLENGALDFYFQQVMMKKGRPGIVLNVLSPSKKVNTLGELILENTSSIGLRYFPVERMELFRKNILMETKYGSIKAKEVNLPSGKKRIKPENDEIIRLSKENDLAPIEVLQSINTKS
jgi:uncharacterized protein (TIGR00299 family) protein